MIPHLRQRYNAQFTEAAYRRMVDEIAERYGHRPPFSIAETPVFIPTELRDHLLRACEDIVNVVADPTFRQQSEGALLDGQIVPDEVSRSHFLQMDFGIVLDEHGKPYPKLIEAQGFPSLYFFQDILADAFRRHFEIPENFSSRFGGLSREDYRQQLRDLIVGDHDPENVILLEIQPEKQTTAIDFFVAREQLGIPMVCISDLEREGRSLYYRRDGRRIRVERIFNRVIFDELLQRQDLQRQFNLIEPTDATWAGHPNWFFRISKHTLPLLDSPYVPRSYFLSDWAGNDADLDKYVLKPLYSFAGSGVKLDLSPADLQQIDDPQNFILQEKVTYAPVIETPDGPAKAEIRMMFLWPDHAERPHLVNNLIRLSKGEMIGVRFNKNKTWVGGTVGFFEP